ncbi:MAG: hypothetical protein WCD86_13330, partial [Ktedonobacteraceae bacterium]
MIDSNETDCSPLTSSMVAHPVRELVWQVSGVARGTADGSGPNSCAWLAKYDRAGVAENPVGILSVTHRRAWGDILGTLVEVGYRCEWGVWGAADGGGTRRR